MKTLSAKRFRALLVLALPVLLGIGPCSAGPGWLERMPGGVLNGEVVTAPVADWSFAQEAGLCQLEVRPSFPHSVTLNCFALNGQLYIGCMACEGKMWSTYVGSDPSARVRISGKVYAVTLNRISHPDEMWVPWLSRWQKLRGNSDAPEIPAGYWLYHVTSRT